MREIQTALTEPQKQLLLHLARANIGSEWHHELHNEIASIKEKLITIARPQACFVTLHLDSRLRGCIGTLEAIACLPDAVGHYARAAAFEDPRFPPLTLPEWVAVTISITLLGLLRPISAQSREIVLSRLAVKKDGLYLKDADHSATFLPMVWQQLPQPETFLDALLQKGGWPTGRWPEHLQAWQYSGEEFSE